MPRKKQRSLLQKAATESAQVLGLKSIKQKATQKENIPPPPTAIQLAEQRILVERSRGDDWMRRYNNERRKDIRSKAQVQNLQAEVKSKEAESNGVRKALSQLDHLVERNRVLKRANNALVKQKKRAPARTALAVAKTTKNAKTALLFSKGMISESCREMIRELVKYGVPEERVNDVIHACCDAFDIVVPRGITARSVGRIVREGGVAAEIQLGHEIVNAKGECRYHTFH